MEDKRVDGRWTLLWHSDVGRCVARCECGATEDMILSKYKCGRGCAMCAKKAKLEQHASNAGLAVGMRVGLFTIIARKGRKAKVKCDRGHEFWIARVCSARVRVDCMECRAALPLFQPRGKFYDRAHNRQRAKLRRAAVLSIDDPCEICAVPETYTRNGALVKLCFDHDHTTGKLRGLLCHACNALLGCMQDDIWRIRGAARYLRQSRENIHWLDVQGSVLSTYLAAQQNLCAICRRTERARRLSRDHDHFTECFRGLLCSQCNRAVGCAADNPFIFELAAAYLEGTLPPLVR